MTLLLHEIYCGKMFIQFNLSILLIDYILINRKKIEINPQAVLDKDGGLLTILPRCTLGVGPPEVV